MNTFAKRLRDAMELRGLSQEQLAKSSDVSQGHISRLINEENMPAIDKAMRLALVLNVSLDWLCGLPSREVGAPSPDEDALLFAYRQLSPKLKEALVNLARGMKVE